MQFFGLFGDEERLLVRGFDEGEEGVGGMGVSSLDGEGSGEETIGFLPGLFVHVYYFIIRPISLETIRSSKISKTAVIRQMDSIWI